MPKFVPATDDNPVIGGHEQQEHLHVVLVLQFLHRLHTHIPAAVELDVLIRALSFVDCDCSLLALRFWVQFSLLPVLHRLDGLVKLVNTCQRRKSSSWQVQQPRLLHHKHCSLACALPPGRPLQRQRQSHRRVRIHHQRRRRSLDEMQPQLWQQERAKIHQTVHLRW